jgi:hypothetical protein
MSRFFRTHALLSPFRIEIIPKEFVPFVSDLLGNQTSLLISDFLW